MAKYEKYVLILIVAFILGGICKLGITLYLGYAYANDALPHNILALTSKAQLYISVFVNIAASFWLFSEAKALSNRAWIWFGLGLFFGILGVILFYIIQIHEKNLTHHSSGTPNGAA